MIREENSKKVLEAQERVIKLIREIDKCQVLEFFEKFIKESWESWK